MHEYLDAGLERVFLNNGYEFISTTFGEAVSYVDLPSMHIALARAILSKHSRLTSGEFLWLRKCAGLTQSRVGVLLDRTEQLVSMIERNRKPIETLLDREFRRLVAEALGIREGIGTVCQLSTYAKESGSAAYSGTLASEGWEFASTLRAGDVSVTQGAQQHIRAQRVTVPTSLGKDVRFSGTTKLTPSDNSEMLTPLQNGFAVANLLTSAEVSNG